MSTLVRITVAGDGASAAAPAVEAAFAVFARVEEAMNEWRPGSPVAALNAAAGSGRWTELPSDLCEVLAVARSGAERTAGLFDPTWAALRGAWRFGDGEPPAVPSRELLERLCPLVSWSGLEVEPTGAGACRARLARPGMQVGLGGIAKGWAVDRAAGELRARGLGDFLVQAGGDLYAAGKAGGGPWRVAVRDPRGRPDEAVAWVEVSDRAFSTTGDYERAFVVGGIRYHHVIDPRTCRPATASRSASVLSATAVEAEILGKAAFILGGEPGLALVERHGASALLIDAEGRRIASPALAGALHPVARPGAAAAGR
jgi:thiamine biosynthesis lipoprotein